MTLSANTFKKMTKNIICIIGTTGVGKSQLSIYLAKALNGEVINADSMQMYENVPQITNKHPIEERFGVKHHVMDHTPWSESYHIHKFQSECQDAINNIDLPIVVGGTHYYLQSVLFNNKTITTGKSIDDLTASQKDLLENGDAQAIWDELNKLDPKVSQKFHPNDKRRVSRALELIYLSNERTSDVYLQQRKDIKSQGLLKYNVLFIWVYCKLDTLDKRLDSRVDKMFQNGAIDELNELFEVYKKAKDSQDTTSGVWQVIGFKEFLPYLESNNGASIDKTFEELMKDKQFVSCLDEMKLRTRRYARRQIKWIKNQLIPELQDESKVMVLDATNLDKFCQCVETRGLEIVNEFLGSENGEIETYDQIPSSLINEDLVKINKTQLKWEHHQCDICKDSSGNPMVFIGDQIQLHLNGRKHKLNINRGKRKQEYEQWLINEKQKSNI